MAPRPLLLALLFLSVAASASARHHLSVARVLTGLTLGHHLPHNHHKHSAPPPATSPAPSPSSPLIKSSSSPQTPAPLMSIANIKELGDILGNLGLPPITSPGMPIDSNDLGQLLKDFSGNIPPTTSPGDLAASGAVVGQLINDFGGTAMPPVSSSENSTQALTDEASNIPQFFISIFISIFLLTSTMCKKEAFSSDNYATAPRTREQCFRTTSCTGHWRSSTTS